MEENKIKMISIEETGLRIKKYRKQRGLTQEELGELTGYCSKQIRRFEHNGIDDLHVINIFAECLKVSPENIIFG